MKKRNPHIQNRQTILLQCGDRKSLMILLLCLTREKQPSMHTNRNATKRKTIEEEDGFRKEKKKEMDFYAQRNSQDERKWHMQRWSLLLCWDSVFL
jgi:hypothetical protein